MSVKKPITGQGYSQLAAADLSDGTTGTGNIVLASSPTLVTPALGAATCTTINGLTITSTTGTLTLTNGKTLAVQNSLTLAGTDSTTLTFQGTGTVVNKDSTDTFTNKTLDTAGTGNVLKINGTQVSAVTGSGSVVLATSPTLVTPTLGAASGTSLALTGLIGTYNNIATVSNGVAAEYANANLTAQTANVAATTAYAVPSTGAGLYRVTVYVVVSQAATTSSTMPDTRIKYTDRDSGSVITVNATQENNANTTTTFEQATFIINAKASTNIQYDVGQVTAYASSGATAMQFAYRAVVEAL